MFALNAVMALVSGGIVFSLALMRQSFRPVEKVVSYMVIVTSRCSEEKHSPLTGTNIRSTKGS
jgi:hypothetical protein